MKIIFNLVLLSAILTVNVLANEGQAALEKIQKHYDSVNTFRAHFVQRAYVKLMDQTQESKGEVIIKKPGKMKWVYNAPDPQILVSNNQTLWLFIPEENQVTQASVRDIYTTNTPALFLSGEGKLAEAFRVTKINRDSGILSVFLVPERDDQDLKQITLLADDKNYQIVGSRVYDRLGNKTEILFSAIEVNVKLPDSLFEFEVPEGVDLLDTTIQPQ
tara:strand:- start:938 stop:1588 length:651 start_codon:yes stop_codon:yes gene_type:complete